MKSSRLAVIVLGAVVALFSGGATLGSYIPNQKLYLLITAAAVGAVALVYFGFTGHEMEKKVVETTRKPKNKKEKKFLEDEEKVSNN